MKQFLLIVSLTCAIALTLTAQVSLSVVSGASFKPGEPVAPQSYAQVWGNLPNLPSAQAPLVYPFPTELAGIQVMIEDVAANLYAVQANVAAFTVPKQTTAGQHMIRIMNGAQVLGQGTIHIAEAFPGVFWNPNDPVGDGNKTQVGGLRRGSDNAYITPETPVARGEAIIIALTGQGNGVNNSPENGMAPVDASSTTTAKPRVFISNIEADVEWSGLMPVFPGLWQINARVPMQSFIGGAVPVIVTFQGVPANEVITYVAE